MKQVIFYSTSASSLSTSATQYIRMNALSTTESLTTFPMPSGGTIRNLLVRLATAPGGSGTRSFTIRKNGSDQAVTVSFGAADTVITDTSHSFTFAAGDLINIGSTLTGTPAASTYRISYEVEFSTAKYNMVIGRASTSGIQYTYPSTDRSGSATIINVPIPHATTLKAIYLDVKTISAGGDFSIYKNGSQLTGTIITLSTTGAYSLTGLNESFSPGDLIAIAPNNAAGVQILYSLLFESATDGESLLLWAFPNLGSSSSRWLSMYKGTATNISQDTQTSVPITSLVMRNMYVYSDTPPGSGVTITFKTNSNAVDTPLEVALSNTNNSVSDTTNSFTYTNSSVDFTIRLNGAVVASPVGLGGVGITQYIAPPAPPSAVNGQFFQFF